MEDQEKVGQDADVFAFDGGAATYWTVFLLGIIVSGVTVGLATPWVICWHQKWRAAHTMIGGRRLEFTGSGGSLIFLWLKWIVFTVCTCGIYMLWMVPSLNKWVVEHTRFVK